MWSIVKAKQFTCYFEEELCCGRAIREAFICRYICVWFTNAIMRDEKEHHSDRLKSLDYGSSVGFWAIDAKQVTSGVPK